MGTKRPLGIPTVMDRVIQQATSQVLVLMFDPGFSAGPKRPLWNSRGEFSFYWPELVRPHGLSPEETGGIYP